MADFICSVWRITHGNTVLLDFGDRLISEPNLSFGKAVEVASPIRAKNVAIFDRGNVQHAPSWQRVVRKASVNDARAWRLDHLLEVQNLNKATVTIQLKDGDSWTMADAVVASCESASGKSVSGHSFDAMMSYELVAGKLEKVTV